MDKLALLAFLSYVGVPYIYRGNSPLTGFDCSGLAIEWGKMTGIMRSRYDNSSQGIYNDFSSKWSPSPPKEMAYVFYGTSKRSIEHVAIMVDDKRVIEAAGGDSTTTTMDEAIKRDARVRLRPYNNRSDIVAILMPNYPLFAINL
jgi:cell wall-associated NlpC family hydrolase